MAQDWDLARQVSVHGGRANGGRYHFERELDDPRPARRWPDQAGMLPDTAMLRLLGRMQIGAILLDGRGRIQRFTPSVRSLYRLSLQDLGQPVDQLPHAFVDLPPLPRLRDLNRAEAIEQEVLHRDGRRFQRWVLLARPGRDAAEGFWVLFMPPATERQHVDQKLPAAPVPGPLPAGPSAKNTSATDEQAELEAIYGAAPVAIALIDPKLRFLKVNRMFAAIDGVPVAAHIGRSIEEVMPALAPRVVPLLRRVLEKGETIGPFEISGEGPDPDNQRIWLDTFAPVRDRQGRMIGVSVVAQDITERRKGEASLRASEDRLTKVLDGLAILAGLLQLDGTLIEANRAALEPAGLERHDVIGKKFWDTYWWSYAPEVQERLKQAIVRARQGIFVRYDVVLRMADNRFITVDFQLSPLRDDRGQVTHLVPSAVDVTARQRAEHELRIREARYRTLFETASVGIAKVGLDGTWIKVNQRLCSILGYSEEELLSRTFADVTCPEDVEESVEAMRRMRDGELRNYSADKRYMRKDGTVIWCNLSSTLHHDEADNSTFFVSVIEDIDSRKKAEETQALLIHELNHRVRNMLAVVKSIAAQTRRHSNSLDEFGVAFDGRIQALATTHTLLAESGWQASSLRGLIAKQLGNHAPRPEAYHIEGPAVAIGPKPALALSLVFHELSTNAVKYGALTAAEGRVDVTWQVKNEPEERPMLHLTWEESHGPRVSPPGRSGFGSLLIDFNITHEFEGRIERDFRPEGLVCRLVMPLPQRQVRQHS